MGSPRQRRWSHRSSLRDSSSHFQVFGRLLPEVRRRGFEKGDQGHPHLLRSIAPRSRPQEERAQEVRGSRRQSQIPEILPLKKTDGNCKPAAGRRRQRPSHPGVGRRKPYVEIYRQKLQTRCGSSSSAAVTPWRWPEEALRGKLQTGRIYIYLSFIFPLFLTFRLSMIMFKLSFTVLFRDIYEF